MTLIVPLLCRDYCIQLSDRRLSGSSGPITDDSSKAGVLTCAAAFGRDPSIVRLSPTQRRLTVMFSGFLYRAIPPLPVFATLSNFQDIGASRDEAMAWDHMVARIGAWPAFMDEDSIKLRAMLKAGKSPQAVLPMAVEAFRRTASQKSAAGTVGGRISAVVLPSDPSRSSDSAYFSDTALPHVFYPDDVVALPGSSFIVKDVQVRAGRPDGPADNFVFPPTARNAPCP